jgi:hypothetical protein
VPSERQPYGHAEIAVLISRVTSATIRWMTPLKEEIEQRAGRDEPEV